MNKLLPLALATLLLSGCTALTGLPEGSADNGDTVTVRYSITDLSGAAIRSERTTTFVIGTGGSGLGLAFERGLRGHAIGDNVTLTIEDDPSLGFGRSVFVDRALADIQRHQDAPRAGLNGFDANVGAPQVGQQFDAFGIYTAIVTGFTADRVNFTVSAANGQEDPVPSVGAILVSTQDDDVIHRTLAPDLDATFVVNPPTQQNPTTPLGLSPGTYKTVGATSDQLEYAYSSSGAVDLVGKDFRVKATVVRLVHGAHDIEPVDGSYVARPAPYVNGDPASVDLAAPDDAPADDHGH